MNERVSRGNPLEIIVMNEFSFHTYENRTIFRWTIVGAKGNGITEVEWEGGED